MKILIKIVFIFLLIFLFESVYASGTGYDKTKAVIRVNNFDTNTFSNIKNYGKILSFKDEKIITKNNLVQNNTISSMPWIALEVENVEIEELLNLENVEFASYFINEGNVDKSFGTCGLMYIELNTSPTLENINFFEEKYNIKVIDILNYNTLKTLVYNDSESDVLKFKEKIARDDLVKSVFFGYYNNFELNCTSDPLFGDQWALENTGQLNGTTGVDVGFCEANNISNGSNITVAIVDTGVDGTHPDLTNNFISEFDPTPFQAAPYGDHGTACAGIIAAGNNNIGVVGLAPSANILSCANLFGVMQSSEFLGQSIDFAWQNGADVISNSWSGGASNNPLVQNPINNALTQGRNGLGAIVVFSTGNDDGDVAYPANFTPNILAVGAVDRCGIRSGRIDIVPNSCDPWCANCSKGSQFGLELDVVAPGTSVFTTDIAGTGSILNDYMDDFGGTSSACPYVAGLAALILSLDPCLTGLEVNDIIEQSCQKVGGFGYANEPNRNNGTWHEEVGYGLIDAEAALQIVLDNWALQNDTETGQRLVSAFGNIRAGRNVSNDANLPNNPYNVAPGAEVEFKATESVCLEDGFNGLAGSEFLAHIETFVGDCNLWDTPVFNQADFSEEEAGKFQANSLIYPEQYEIEHSFFPNPYNQDLFVKYDLGLESENVIIQIFDFNGNMVYEQSFDGHSGTNMHRLDFDSKSQMLIAKICIGNNCQTTKLLRQ